MNDERTESNPAEVMELLSNPEFYPTTVSTGFVVRSGEHIVLYSLMWNPITEEYTVVSASAFDPDIAIVLARDLEELSAECFVVEAEDD